MLDINFDEDQKVIYAKIKSKIQKRDFENNLKPAVDKILEHKDEINGVMLDATDFHGWDSLEALEEHLGFVKNYHKHIKRLAVVTGHEWQKFLPSIANLVLNVEIKCFNANQQEDAKAWLLGKKLAHVN